MGHKIESDPLTQRMLSDWKEMISMLDSRIAEFEAWEEKYFNQPLIEDIQYIADYYEEEAQSLQTVEELSELIQVIVKEMNRPEKIKREDIVSEIADVEIMLEQYKYLKEITDDEISDAKRFKVSRQLDRIKSESSELKALCGEAVCKITGRCKECLYSSICDQFEAFLFPEDAPCMVGEFRTMR